MVQSDNDMADSLPLHGFISKSMMIIGYAGRKSGKRYETPVNYVRNGEVSVAAGERVIIIVRLAA